MEFERNELSKNSKGGTELIMERLYNTLPEELLSKFQIIPSRVRQLDEKKVRILYAHDLPEDPESENAFRRNGGWARFNKIVFVSHWQRNQFVKEYEIDWSKTAVIQNSIIPFERKEKPKGQIKFIYHTTPHRGLNILVAVFKKLYEKYGDEIHLDVYSSFEIYGWPERDQPFLEMFEEIKNHPGMTYHGFKPNDVIRTALSDGHIYAYPSIWPETSCISLMEAMGAGLICVHPDSAALPETSGGWTYMYPWHENLDQHAQMFLNVSDLAVQQAKANLEKETFFDGKLSSQMSYINLFHNWEVKKHHWEALLNNLKNESTELKKSFRVFKYHA